MSKLAQLNTMDARSANEWFMQTCTAIRWCELMTESRPYPSIDHLNKQAISHWQSMQRSDYMQAFEGHPMIGDIHSLRKKYAATKAIAGNEQAGTASASDTTLQALQQTNKDYLAKHGFIFIICASGLSADTMLLALQKRISNDTNTEIKTAAQEQLKITLLRIEKALSDSALKTTRVKETPDE